MSQFFNKNQIDIKPYAFTINLVVKDRINVYQDRQEINDYFIKLTNKFYTLLGKSLYILII